MIVEFEGIVNSKYSIASISVLEVSGYGVTAVLKYIFDLFLEIQAMLALIWGVLMFLIEASV